MSVKGMLKGARQAIRRMPVLAPLLNRRPVRFRLQRWPGAFLFYGRGWELLHPYDFENDTDTSGFVLPEESDNNSVTPGRNNPYAGSQPSIIREALKTIPGLETFTFIDLGCGKGRPLLVASEFPFRRLIGVELSSPLAQVAQENVDRMLRRHPERSPVQIENCDATTFAFPSGNLVVFLYNPFGQEVIRRVIANLEQALATPERSVFVVYYNPVCGACLDACPALERYFSKSIPYAEEERGFGPDDADAVVAWQGGTSLPALSGADARIDVIRPGERAEISARV